MPNSVLLIDDHELTRKLTRAWLRRLGFETLEAGDAQQAFRVVQSRFSSASTAEPLFSAVLLDLSLPGRDGWSILQQLRAHPAGAALLILAYTASPEAVKADHEFDGLIKKTGQFEQFAVQFRQLVPSESLKP